MCLRAVRNTQREYRRNSYPLDSLIVMLEENESVYAEWNKGNNDHDKSFFCDSKSDYKIGKTLIRLLS